MEQVPTPLTSQCQIHAGQPFTAVCQRCGTYMCSFCTEGGRYAVCAECRARGAGGAFPLRRDNYTFGGLFEHAMKVYKANWVAISVAMVLGFIALMFSQGLSQIPVFVFRDSPFAIIAATLITFPLQIIVQGVFSLGMFNIGIVAARGEKVEIEHLFSVWKRLGTWFAQSLVLGALLMPLGLVAVLIMFVAVGSSLFSGEEPSPAALITGAAVCFALFVPIMIYVLPGIAFANCEIVAQPVGAIAGLQNSWRMAAGHRLNIILIYFVSGAIAFAGVLACGVGILFAAGLITCLFASFYLALRNGATDLRT